MTPCLIITCSNYFLLFQPVSQTNNVTLSDLIGFVLFNGDKSVSFSVWLRFIKWYRMLTIFYWPSMSVYRFFIKLWFENCEELAQFYEHANDVYRLTDHLLQLRFEKLKMYCLPVSVKIIVDQQLAPTITQCVDVFPTGGSWAVCARRIQLPARRRKLSEGRADVGGRWADPCQLATILGLAKMVLGPGSLSRQSYLMSAEHVIIQEVGTGTWNAASDRSSSGSPLSVKCMGVLSLVLALRKISSSSDRKESRWGPSKRSRLPE